MPKTINPATGETLQDHPYFEADEVDSRLARAHETFEAWRHASVDKRAGDLTALAQAIRDGREPAAKLMTDEMGKPIEQARGELDKCARLCDYFAKNGPAMLADQGVETEACRSYVSHQPLGVILAIMPWNFPWWQVLRFAVPALLAGNTVLLKHAEGTIGTGFLIEKTLHEAGFPVGALENVLVDHEGAAKLIRSPHVAGVTLTGSTRAGRAVAAIAGEALKKTVLELGGSDPYVVLADADLDRAAEVCVHARLLNSGQSCIAAKRWIVVDEVADAFADKVQARLAKAVVGDPHDPGTTVGPLARAELRDELHRQVQASVEAGASLRMGGEIPEGPGAFYPVTLLDCVRPGMVAADEELFGPVATIIRVQNKKEAIGVANTTSYGLGAAVFTGDAEEGERIAKSELQAGAGFVNAFVRSDPRLPFGGVKDSGYGRELAAQGLYEWVNTKTIWVA